MSGSELAKQIETRYPSVKILFMSGYTDDRLTLQTLLEQDVPILTKPLSMETVGNSIRAVLAGKKIKSMVKQKGFYGTM